MRDRGVNFEHFLSQRVRAHTWAIVFVYLISIIFISGVANIGMQVASIESIGTDSESGT